MKAIFKKSLVFRYAVPLILLFCLLITGIYAWIYGDVAPTISGQMKVGDTTGLVFQIDTDKTQLINLNENLGLSTSNMTLNEVSTVDGVHFIKRDTSQFFLESGNPDRDEEIITFIEAQENSKEISADGIANFVGDYTKVKLNLVLDYADSDAEYYVYFLNGKLNSTNDYITGYSAGEGSTITEDGLKSLRTCLKVEGADEYGQVLNGLNHSAFFGNSSESKTQHLTKAIKTTVEEQLRIEGSANSYSAQIAGNYYIDYLFPTEEIPVQHSFGELENGIDVCAFSDYSIDAEDGLSGSTLPSSNYLFKLNKDCKKVTITLTLWLEGGSVYCQNDNLSIDDKVNFNMYFVAYKLQ